MMNVKRNVGWLVCLFLFLLQAQTKLPAKEKMELKLMSYNIRFVNSKDTGVYAWKSRREANIKMFKKVKPDVFGIQEPTPEAISYLKKHLLQYDSYGRCGKKVTDRVPTIFWLRDRFELLDCGHFWVSDTPEVISKGWDAMHYRPTSWVKLRECATGKEFYYFNTHLDHKGSEAKKNGVRVNVEQMQKIAGNDAVVFISGDMNIQRHKNNGYFLNPYYDWMKGARESARHSTAAPTFNGFKDEKKKAAYLDYIFYRGNDVKARRFKVCDEKGYGVKYISDHYPIVCEFKL